jgi:hypothetical protein
VWQLVHPVPGSGFLHVGTVVAGALAISTGALLIATGALVAQDSVRPHPNRASIDSAGLSFADSATVVVTLRWRDPKLKLLLYRTFRSRRSNSVACSVRLRGLGLVPISPEAYTAIISFVSAPDSPAILLPLRPLHGTERAVVRSRTRV